jgi:hypothetical protein
VQKTRSAQELDENLSVNASRIINDILFSGSLTALEPVVVCLKEQATCNVLAEQLQKA